MKKLFSYMLLFISSSEVMAGGKDSTVYYTLPDSVKAVQFMAEIKITELNTSKHFRAGIQTNLGSLYLFEHKGKRGISFQMHEYSRILSTGQGVKNPGLGGFYFAYTWQTDKIYKLMVAMAADSADKICIYSAYIFLPDENKWKFIGSRRHPFWRDKLQEPCSFLIAHKKSTGKIIVGEVWCQRSNGSWRNMKNEDRPVPTINFFGHADSVHQRQVDIKLIENAIASGKTDVRNNLDGVYYKIIKEGTGKQVSVNDTVTVNYRLTLFNDTAVIDQTKEKPATFPLKRLVKGWQTGLPLCKVGGKIKLVLPSDLAYSIRTRAAKIPPNSILLFEIEVVDAKSPL